MKPNPKIYHAFLRAFEPTLSANVSRATKKGAAFSLPRFSPDGVAQICRDAATTFASEPTLLELTSPVIVVGDLHGHILDLVRIFQTYGLPPKSSYLFLGDLIDRGEFSTETVLLLFILKVLYPRSVNILRGNHEFQNSAEQFGFLHEVTASYTRATFDAFMQAFSWLPLAAVIDRTTLCIHGGVGSTLSTAGQIRLISRPILNLESDVVSGMLWSDPTDETDGFVFSRRGAGAKFGQTALFELLAASRLERLVRGHEFKQEGTSTMFDGHCVTIFSASNYCGMKRNVGAVMEMRGPEEMEAKIFPPLDYLKRGCATFVPVEDPPGVMRQAVAHPREAPQSPRKAMRLSATSGRNPQWKSLSTYSLSGLIEHPIAIDRLKRGK